MRMEKVLTNKNLPPTDELIYSYIGETKSLWIAFFDYIHKQHPDFVDNWNYYNDGKSWMLKLTRKAKTIGWISVWQDAFRLTFYFTDKVEDSINESELSEELKEQFKLAKHYGKIRPITIVFRNDLDIKYAKILIAIRMQK